MKELIRNLGVILILLGVAALAVPAFMATQTNDTLLLGLCLVIGGLLAHIIINRFVEDK